LVIIYRKYYVLGKKVNYVKKNFLFKEYYKYLKKVMDKFFESNYNEYMNC